MDWQAAPAKGWQGCGGTCGLRPALSSRTHRPATPTCAALPSQVAHVLAVMQVPEERAALQGALDEEQQGLLDDAKRQALQAAGVDPAWCEGVPHPQLFARLHAALEERVPPSELSQLLALTAVAKLRRVSEPGTRFAHQMLALAGAEGEAGAVALLGLAVEGIVRWVWRLGKGTCHLVVCGCRGPDALLTAQPPPHALRTAAHPAPLSHIYPFISRAVASAFRGLPPADAVFLPLHVVADDDHAAVLRGVAARLAGGAEARFAMVHAVRKVREAVCSWVGMGGVWRSCRLATQSGAHPPTHQLLRRPCAPAPCSGTSCWHARCGSSRRARWPRWRARPPRAPPRRSCTTRPRFPGCARSPPACRTSRGGSPSLPSWHRWWLAVRACWTSDVGRVTWRAGCAPWAPRKWWAWTSAMKWCAVVGPACLRSAQGAGLLPSRSAPYSHQRSSLCLCPALPGPDPARLRVGGRRAAGGPALFPGRRHRGAPGGGAPPARPGRGHGRRGGPV